MNNTDLTGKTMVAFGAVVNVRPIPTRQVTQIVIEIPDHHHIAATQMLFGKDAFVLAAHGAQGPYGVVPLNMETMTPEAQPAQSKQSGSPATMLHAGLQHNIDPVRWLGIQCQAADFMYWLGVANASEAAEQTRLICGVESRSEIANNTEAQRLFMDKIYLPFNQARRANASLGSAMGAGRQTSTGTSGR